jgi:hypothetical protein
MLNAPILEADWAEVLRSSLERLGSDVVDRFFRGNGALLLPE